MRLARGARALFGITRTFPVENIRIADELLIDLLFAANGQTYASVQPYVRELEIEGVLIKVLNIDGLFKTKTDYRDKRVLDKGVSLRIKDRLNQEN